MCKTENGSLRDKEVANRFKKRLYKDYNIEL